MNPDVAIDLFKSTVLFAIYVVAPFLALTLIVGLIASLADRNKSNAAKVQGK
jgi:flagellar biosynthetic protein FliQ